MPQLISASLQDGSAAGTGRLLPVAANPSASEQRDFLHVQNGLKRRHDDNLMVLRIAKRRAVRCEQSVVKLGAVAEKSRKLVREDRERGTSPWRAALVRFEHQARRIDWGGTRVEVSSSLRLSVS